nr:YeiH family protein [Rhizobium halophytocola]
MRIAPGLLLCLAVTGLAIGLETLEENLLGGRWLESLVLAIILGAMIRSGLTLSPRFHAGIDFSAKFLLELAVVLLGASISTATLEEAGFGLVGGIAGGVAVSLIASYFVGRMLGLPAKLATLVACGNSICGNSAIAAAAPVIDAPSDDVAASIAFTAVLGVIAVLVMPLVMEPLGMDAVQYGTFAGMTVYAVPQVLAATAPIGLISVQTGTVVKLIRVLMLGPVLLVLGVIHGRSGGHMSLRHILPWFILGFAVMMGLRSFDLIPALALKPISETSSVLTIIAMAALGLSVDVRHVAKAGGRVIAAASVSLLLLCGISLLLIHWLQVG